MEKKKVFTTNNIFNVIKIILIALFFVFYLSDKFYLDGDYPIYAIFVFILICFLDILNNLNSKNYTTKTNFEKVFGPITNILFRNSVLIAFNLKNVLPLYVVLILGITDLITLILGTYLLTKKIIFKSHSFSKITTIVMNISLFSCFFKVAIYPFNLIFVLISVAMVLVSLLIYILKFHKLYNLA